MKKEMSYATKTVLAISSMFDKKNSYYIDPNDFNDPVKFAEFLHAIANEAPTHIHNQLTSLNFNVLDFNHLANNMCMQYGNFEDGLDDDKVEKENPDA